MNIRGITISVGYAETLAICLPRNVKHFSECLVVTSPDDHATQEVARSVQGVRLFVTEAHREHGARFNKGLALERGFSEFGRHGNILIHDADILLPDFLPLELFRPGCLHGARRRILPNAQAWTPDLDWRQCEVVKDGKAPIGFFQLFAADDPVLRGKLCWYDVSFAHAGGSDAYFMSHWPRSKWRRLPLEVLHLGPIDRHWFGVDAEAKDIMAAYVTRNAWTRAIRGLDPEAAKRAGDFITRVQVPGYEPSSFQLPFEKRSRTR